VIIVAIGESVVSLGSGLDAATVRWPLIRVVTLGFALWRRHLVDLLRRRRRARRTRAGGGP
jgi:hypothetical protein